MPPLGKGVSVSDEHCPPVLLGSTHKGLSSIRVSVKNTFVDVPLYTPESTKHTYHNEKTWTCPANLSKSLAFEETPEAVDVTLSTNDTPPIQTDVIPPTPSPSPVHAWELQRQRMPCRIAPLSFDSAKPCHERQVDTAAWPTLFENIVADSAVDTPNASGIGCKSLDLQRVKIEEKQHEESDDGSSDDEAAICNAPQPQDVPQPPPGALHPSVGSERHALGACRRCCFFPRGRCMNGYDCEFCHYEHDKRKRKNKTKKRAEAAVMRLAPRATIHAAPMAYGASLRGWMYQPPPSPHQPCASFAYSSVAPSMSSMLAPPPLIGHRVPEPPVAYPAPMMMPMQQQQQTCFQQFVVYGAGQDQSLAASSATGAVQGAQQFGRQVIQLPPAVSEQAAADSNFHAPYTPSGAHEVDFEISPPPPPPVCPPNLPQMCASLQQHSSLPPSASPRLMSREAN